MQNDFFTPASVNDDLTVSTTTDDVIIPFIKIIQNLSNELISGKDKYNANLKAGDLYDSLTKTIFKNPKTIICGMRKYYAEWTPQVRGMLVSKHLENSEVVKSAIRNEYIKSNGSIGYMLKTPSGNDLLESYGALLLIKNGDGMILPGRFTFSKSSFIVGKELNSILSFYQSGGIPIFDLSTNLTSNSRGSWYKPVFVFSGYETDTNIINLAKRIAQFTDKIILE